MLRELNKTWEYKQVQRKDKVTTIVEVLEDIMSKSDQFATVKPTAVR